MRCICYYVSILVLTAFASGCAPIVAPTAAASEEAADVLEAPLEFVTHIEFDTPEQDVFIESSDDPSQVMRVTVEAASDPANQDKMLYTAAEGVHHDPMQTGSNPLGPYPKGDPLDMTLQEWLAATGQGTYILYGDSAVIDVTLQNLVPNGIYTAWCGRMSFEPVLAMVDRPCGPVDGSAAMFQADAEGNAAYSVTVNPAPASDERYFSDIAFAYHSDGETYGTSPGEFGKNSHVQLFVLDPPPAPVAREPIVAQIEFITHVEAGMPEQDVFVESSEDSSQVVRVEDEAATEPATLDQMIYAAAEPAAHDPLEVTDSPYGPFPKGDALGITLGEWLAASATGTYTIEDAQATLDVALQNLVPNGIYTAWCGVLTVGDEGMFGADMPCGLLDGSQSIFEADEEGNAHYRVTMPALPASTETTFSDIAFAYHSDGQTCGSSPCDFGLNSHIQLFIAEPPPAPTDLPAQ